MNEEKQLLNNKLDTAISLPTKEEIIKILREENPPIDNKQKYKQLIFVLELKKIKDSIGILKGEYYEDDVLGYRGSLLIPLGKPNPNQQNHFDEMNTGENRFYGFTLDSRESKFPEQFVGFFKRSFQGTSIQDFIPGLNGTKKTE